MFENVRADLYDYGDRAYPGLAMWRAVPKILFSHPASVAVIWYRFGAWAWRSRLPGVGVFAKALYLLVYPLVRLYSGVQIHPTTPIGPGLVILHFGGVVLARDCTIGSHCVLHQNVNIVTTNDRRAARIGNNFYAGCGAIIVNHLIIEDNVVCGAGSVVTHSIPQNAIVAGVPARIVRFRRPEEQWPKVRVGKHDAASFLSCPDVPDEADGSVE